MPVPRTAATVKLAPSRQVSTRCSVSAPVLDPGRVRSCSSVFKRSQVRLDQIFHRTGVGPRDGEGPEEAHGVYGNAEDRTLPIHVGNTRI